MMPSAGSSQYCNEVLLSKLDFFPGDFNIFITRFSLYMFRLTHGNKILQATLFLKHTVSYMQACVPVLVSHREAAG